MSLVDGGFKSPEARGEFLATYDHVRALSPRPTVVHDVPTKFGTVRVYQHGSSGDLPVVFLHGFFLTSAMWWEQVAGLEDLFSVYTIDLLGQPGASIQTESLSTPADCAHSIDAVLEGLGLRGVHLVGHSYGGWLATHTAALAPGRLATLTLVDPASTVTRLLPRFWRSLAVLLTRPRSARARRAAEWVTGHPAAGSPVDELAGLLVAGFAAFGPPRSTPRLRFSGDRLLRSVALPVQVLLAGNSVHNVERALRRLNSVVPGWEHRLWPNASHALPAEVPAEVNDCIREFVTRRRSGN